MIMKSSVNVFIKYLCLCFVLLMTSCNEDFLNVKPEGELSMAVFWKDKDLANTFINGIYNDQLGFYKYSANVFCDDCQRRDGSSYLSFNKCLITPDNIPAWAMENWANLFKTVRKCNTFLENIDQATFPTDAMIGEVRFLRAWYYFNLTRLWGGVPIVSKTFQLTDDFIVPRDSYADCIKFIVDDLDKAANLLPVVQPGDNDGRVTKGAALALKSRVLLYAASDLHNTTVFPGYTNPELIGYTDANRTVRWQAAKDAAKAVIDMNVYSLYKPNPAPTDSVAKNYEELFITKKIVQEDIWVKYYLPVTVSGTQNLNLLNAPNGYGGEGNNAPTGNLVDAFEMRDGTKFDWNNPAHAALPYNYREPRFYAYILYDGAKWTIRPAMSINLDPIGIVHSGYFQRWNNTTQAIYLEGGIDSRSSPFVPSNSSQTLYFTRKELDPKVPPSTTVFEDVTYRYIRYAEVLLNYAEACIELGQDAEARTYINMVRTRAGLPGVTESGAALRTRYRNERRIELFYEGQRFDDVRRWVIGPAAYGKTYKANVLYKLLPDKTTSTVPTIIHELLETRAWIDKAYFFPILRDEMNKNNKLIQNPGY